MRSSKQGYSRSRSHTRSRSHSPHEHHHVHHSPKRSQKSPLRTTSKSSKHTPHVPRAVSPHSSRSSRKSNYVRPPKYSRSPSKNIRTKSKSISPVKDSKKDSKTTKKNSDSDSPGCSSVTKKKKPTKSPAKQYNSKVKVSETSLFAELVKDRQMRELAMKCLTQISTKTVDKNEVVEIHDDNSDYEQNNSKINDSNTKLQKNDVKDDVDSCVIEMSENKTSKPEIETSNVKFVTSSKTDITPKIPMISQKRHSPSITKVVANGIEHSLEPTLSLTPPEKKSAVIENKDLVKLPPPPVFSILNDISPDSEFKSSKKSIKDLPLPPGKFLF